MEKNITLSERYANELLTDNASLNHFNQCKDCIFRDKRFVDGKEYGYDKCVCRVYGMKTALESTYSNGESYFSYSPIEFEDKPKGIYDNTEECDYYEKE